jgi:hypothetical protein
MPLRNTAQSDESYAAAEKTMGLESLMALVALVAAVGSFSIMCLTAATFQIDPLPGAPLCPGDDAIDVGHAAARQSGQAAHWAISVQP